MSDSILLLQSSEAFREGLEPLLRPLELSVVAEPLSASLDGTLASADPGLIVLDFGDGDAPLPQVIHHLRETRPDCPVLAVASAAGVNRAVELMDSGIDDYLIGPPVAGDLLARCRRLRAGHGLRRRLGLLQSELNRRYGAHRIVCRSSAMQAVYQRVLQLAPTRTTVLVGGESGSGKELVARSLHYNSGRRDRPFVAMNCGAVTETLIESELFGHDRGAFTGAVATVPGKFELADRGTLFLDEVGSMGLATQVRLLRVLEEGEFMRVGGTRTLRVDVRVIAATNSDLTEQVARGEFRQDLLYRLKVATIEVPPLRKRPDDVPPLARTFVRQLCEENGLPPKELAPETLRILETQDWPGNVRELKNLLESLVVTVPDEQLRPEHLPAQVLLAPPSRGDENLPPPGLSLEELERRYIEATLRAEGGNRTRAARLLGIGVRTLQRKIQRYGLDVPPPASG
jgi:DNA-binding NtrC family response regulator